MPNIRIEKRPSRFKPTTRISPRDYLEILFNELEYDRLHRNDKLSLELGRPVKFLDELDENETKKMISILREQKYGSNENV